MSNDVTQAESGESIAFDIEEERDGVDKPH
jgi:hypothetical protein